jgi:hypothetical protein
MTKLRRCTIKACDQGRSLVSQAKLIRPVIPEPRSGVRDPFRRRAGVPLLHRKLCISLKEIDECCYWLELIMDSNMLAKPKIRHAPCRGKRRVHKRVTGAVNWFGMS